MNWREKLKEIEIENEGDNTPWKDIYNLLEEVEKQSAKPKKEIYKGSYGIWKGGLYYSVPGVHDGKYGDGFLADEEISEDDEKALLKSGYVNLEMMKQNPYYAKHLKESKMPTPEEVRVIKIGNGLYVEDQKGMWFSVVVVTMPGDGAYLDLQPVDNKI